MIQRHLLSWLITVTTIAAHLVVADVTVVSEASVDVEMQSDEEGEIVRFRVGVCVQEQNRRRCWCKG